MKKKITVSIIIVNYKVEKELLDCISSIYRSKSKTIFEIIVVDNDEQKTIEDSLKSKFPKVKYIKSEKNIGYGAGNNLGASNALGEYLFILNPDTLFLNNVIDNLINFTKKNKKVGAVAPLLFDKSNKPYKLQGIKELTPKRSIFSLSILCKIFPDNTVSNSYWNSEWDKKNDKEVDIVPGTAFLISRKLFYNLAGFDEKFFLFFEESDLCNQIRKLGFKNYITPSARLFHKWGASTAKNENTEKYFKQSRFYYFKKNYGLIKAYIVEFILRINKYNICLTGIIILALFLRFYKLKETVSFIGDFAWFYVSARDMILNHQIPLVGITSSHVWLHQGAFWTYILGLLFMISKFNPFLPAYFTSFADIITISLIYYLAKNMFDKKIALIGALFYATSPLIITHINAPYHTSLIPLFTTLFIICIYKWVKGKVIFFPIALFFLAVLYNFEIATTALSITLFIFIFFSFIMKKTWAINLLNLRIIFFSIIAYLIPMIPMIIYDVNHGFPQTVKVYVWIGYRLAILFGYPQIHPNSPAENWQTFTTFLLSILQKFYFIRDQKIAVIIFIFALAFASYKLIESKFKNTNLLIIFIFLVLPLLSYIAAKTNSEAYVLMFFPQAAILLGFLFGSFKGKLMMASYALIAIIVIFNSIYIVNFRKITNLSMDYRIEMAKRIVNDANGRRFNIIGLGQWSKYESFTSNTDFLTWWLGNGPSKENQKLKYYISEPAGNIVIKNK